MSILLAIFEFVLISYLTYKCFERDKFWHAYFITFVLSSFSTLIKNGFYNYLKEFVFIALGSYISTKIYHWLYKKSTSFANYMILSIVASVIIGIILSAIIYFVVLGILFSMGNA